MSDRPGEAADESALAAGEVERIADDIDARGYAVAEGVIPEDLRRALVGTIDRCFELFDVPFGGNAFLGTRTRRLFNLLARDRLFERTPVFAGTLPVVERVLDDECLLSSLTAIEMNPGQAAQPLHADTGSYGLPRPAPTAVVVAMWALTDFTTGNGGTRVVPGSHRAADRPRPGDDPETVAVEMPAGSVLFYDGALWHGGGENRTGARRLAIVNNYCAGWLRQEEAQLLAIPRERVAAFPSRLRRLVGYGTYRGLIGHVDQQSPERLVDPDAPSAMVWDRIRG